MATPGPEIGLDMIGQRALTLPGPRKLVDIYKRAHGATAYNPWWITSRAMQRWAALQYYSGMDSPLLSENDWVGVEDLIRKEVTTELSNIAKRGVPRKEGLAGVPSYVILPPNVDKEDAPIVWRAVVNKAYQAFICEMFDMAFGDAGAQNTVRETYVIRAWILLIPIFKILESMDSNSEEYPKINVALMESIRKKYNAGYPASVPSAVLLPNGQMGGILAIRNWLGKYNCGL